MTKQTIGEFLATLRKANGFTQLEVAERLGISNRTLSAWECGTALPDILLLPALADLYNVTVDEIISGERKSNPSVQIATRSQNKILQNKLAKLITPCFLLTGLAILGLTLFLIGFYIDLVTISWTGWQWWLLLLFGGATTATVSIIVLIAKFAGEKANADEEMEGYPVFCLAVSKKLSFQFYCLAIALAVAFLVFLALLFDGTYSLIDNDKLLFGSYNDKIVILPLISFVGVVAFALSGFVSYRASLKTHATPQILEQLRRSDKTCKKLALWGLILVFVFIAFCVLAICLTKVPLSNTERTVYSTSRREQFLTEMECYYFNKSQYQDESFYNQLPETGYYYFDITSHANRETADFGGGFYGQYVKDKNICMLYCLVDTDNDSADEQLFLANFYRYWAEDLTWSVFVAKYWDYPVTTRPEGGPDFTIKEQFGKISLTVSKPNYVAEAFGSWASAISCVLTVVYYSVIFTLAVTNQNKLKIKI